MEPVDGNAMAGDLAVLFGREMTAARARCAHCAAVAPLAEAVVYDGGPGVVARCRTCGLVVLVVTRMRATVGVHLHLAFVDGPESSG